MIYENIYQSQGIQCLQEVGSRGTHHSHINNVFTACNQKGNTGGGGGKPTPPKPKHAITFGVEGANGTLKAKAEGVTETETSPVNVEEGKEVTFTAKANGGYRVKGWTLDGATIAEAGIKTEYKLTVTKPVTVKVSFESIPAPLVEGGVSLILSPNKHFISVIVKTADGSDVQVEGCHGKNQKLRSGSIENIRANGNVVILKGKITELSCYRNELMDINAQGLTTLEYLNCGTNLLTSLNVQGLTALKELNCCENRLTSLNISGCTSLQKLWCWGNRLDSLDVKGLTSLLDLNCGKNKLTSLDVQGLTSLKELHCYNNQFKSLDVKGLTSLQIFSCSNNQLTELDVKGLTALKSLECYGNQLTELNVKDLPALTQFDCYSNKLTILNMQGLTALKSLDCNDNQLTELNVQGLTALQRLDCQKNKLTSLNVTVLTDLKNLNCFSNELNAQAMKELLNALPARSEDDHAWAYLYTEKDTEGNHKDFTTASEVKTAFEGAKNKKWALKKRNAKGYPEDIFKL